MSVDKFFGKGVLTDEDLERIGRRVLSIRVSSIRARYRDRFRVTIHKTSSRIQILLDTLDEEDFRSFYQKHGVYFNVGIGRPPNGGHHTSLTECLSHLIQLKQNLPWLDFDSLQFRLNDTFKIGHFRQKFQVSCTFRNWDTEELKQCLETNSLKFYDIHFRRCGRGYTTESWFTKFLETYLFILEKVIWVDVFNYLRDSMEVSCRYDPDEIRSFRFLARHVKAKHVRLLLNEFQQQERWSWSVAFLRDYSPVTHLCLKCASKTVYLSVPGRTTEPLPVEWVEEIGLPVIYEDVRGDMSKWLSVPYTRPFWLRVSSRLYFNTPDLYGLALSNRMLLDISIDKNDHWFAPRYNKIEDLLRARRVMACLLNQPKERRVLSSDLISLLATFLY